MLKHQKIKWYNKFLSENFSHENFTIKNFQPTVLILIGVIVVYNNYLPGSCTDINAKVQELDGESFEDPGSGS